MKTSEEEFMKCKTCSSNFHYCTNCGDDFSMYLGFCSDKCRYESQSYKIAKSRLIALCKTLNGAQIKVLSDIIENINDYYNDYEVLDWIEESSDIKE